MTAANTIELSIDKRAMGYAKIYASLLSDEFQRKRAYASIAALYSLVNVLEKTDNDVQKSMTLFRNPALNENYEINDFYINDWHIDVRVVTGGNSFLVPKCHFDNEIEPDFYAVIKVDKELKSAELLGFADTAFLTKDAYDYHYYSVSFDTLISFDKFIEKINKPKLTNFAEQEHDMFKSNFLSLLDNEIDCRLKNKLLKHLFECSECRTEFCCFTGFEMVSCNIGKYPEMIEDHTLNIVGAQAVDDEKYAGKEEIINITDDDNIDDNGNDNNNIDDVKEPESQDSTVSDILDELFSDGDEVIQDNPDTEKSVDVDLKQADDSEFDILADDGSESLEMLDDYNEDKSSNLEILDNGAVETLNEADDDLIINSENTENSENEINIIDNDNSNMEILNEEETSEADNVQKVIVDYDENGEPIYSYITNIPPEDEKNADFEAELSDDDILNSTFETYPQYNELDVDLSTIKNESSRIEYVQNDEENNDVTQNNDELEEYSAEPVSTDSESIETVVSDYNEETENEYENVEGDVINSENEIMSAEVDYKGSDEIVYNEPEEEEQTDSKYNDDSGSDEDAENEEYDEYQDEYEEDNDSDYLIGENNNKSSNGKNKLLVPVLILLIALVTAGVGGYMLMNNKSSNNNIAQSETQDTVQVQESDNDMFEQPAGDNTSGNEENNMGQGNTENQPISIENNQQEMPSQGTIEVPPSPNNLTEQDLIKNARPSTSDVNQAITNAFATGANSVSVRGVNWLCSPQLFTENEFKNYLQKLDNILKLNLRKNILDITENPKTDSVSVKLAVDNDGNLTKYIISDSSGSQQIDNIVLQSIKETFDGEKSPILTNSDLKSDTYYLKVVIKL